MSLCIHCDLEAPHPFYDDVQKQIGPFCCQGCLTVYNVIKMKGLSQYYDIKDKSALFKKRGPANLPSGQYSYMDDFDFHEEYSYKGNCELQTMEFYLEGIHCLACLWIIEKLPGFVKDISQAKLDMGRSIVTISLRPGGKFSTVAKELENIGYRPHPLKINQEINDFKIKENRSMLLRIGIAGAATGNIMLYAISLYAGAGLQYEKIFNLFILLFAFPVLTYSAFPFYKNSYHALKNKQLSIDIPISLALFAGGIMGFYNFFIGVHENYFDSLTALIFLLLTSRYFLKIVQEKGLSTTDLHFFYRGENVLRFNFEKNNFNEIHPKSIQIGDLLKILPSQMIPADGIVTSGISYLDNSLLTGESKLEKVTAGSLLYSGTMNMGDLLEMKVLQINKKTKLGHILKIVEDGWGQKSKIVSITNEIAKYFIGIIFILSVLLFIYKLHTHNIKEAFELSLTLLIVTCPCALAIATPLAFTRTLAKSAAKGIVIKDDAVIEKLSQAENVFIDKTGTLTQNYHSVSNFKINKPAQVDLYDVIYNLEKNSRHPIGRILKEYAQTKSKTEYPISNFKETLGLGVSGIIKNNFYEIKNYGLYENDILIATFDIKDKLRPDALTSLSHLKKFHIHFKILSGDKKEYVEEIASQLNLTPSEFSYALSPEEKGEIIKSSKSSVMVGDGANDTIALRYADTGIAVYGAMDISLRAADVYLTTPGLEPLVNLFIISNETMKVIYRNLFLSLLYNFFSIYLAFTGHISPLIAAIIMPLSSLSVLISTIIGTKELREQWK